MSKKLSLPVSRFAALMNQFAPSGANGRASAAAIYHVDGSGSFIKTLFEKNAHVEQAVASTQKVITAYVLDPALRP